MKKKLKTSNEVYDEYRKLRDREEKLTKNNKGLNLLGNFIERKPRGFYISLMVETKVNLKGKKENIDISSNLPFFSYSYSYDKKGIQDFLDKLKEYCKKPFYKFPKQRNRKADNKMSMWRLPNFREEKILFEEIDFRIGEKAVGKLHKDKLDFVEVVKSILKYQKQITNEEETDFNKYFLLCERIEDLKRQINHKENYGYGYGYKKVTDTTLTFEITKEEFNKKLKVLEMELKSLCDKYEVLTMPNIRYKEIVKQMSCEDWCIDNEEDVRDSWDNDEDEEVKEELDNNFDNYLVEKYEQYVENTDFD